MPLSFRQILIRVLAFEAVVVVLLALLQYRYSK
jgi:hypothetical protein